MSIALAASLASAIERRADGVRPERLALPAVLAGRLTARTPLHLGQRRTQDVTDAEGDRPFVIRRDVRVEQVLDQSHLARGEDLFGNLTAGGEVGDRERPPVPAPPSFELEYPIVGHQHEETALGTRHVDRRIEDKIEDVVQHTGTAHRAQPFK